MKKILFIACSLFVATMLAGCLDKGKASSKTGSQTVIKSVDGSQKVDLAGTWVAKDGNYTFKMIFGSDGSLTYGCGGGSHGGPEQLSVGSDGGLRVDKEFNSWWIKGTYKTSGNILTLTYNEFKDYSGALRDVKKGDANNFVVNIVSNDELVIQLKSIRTYKRQ